MMRIGQERLRGVAAIAGLANDTAAEPRRPSRVRPGDVIASAQGRLTDLPCPGCDRYQADGSWRMTPEKPITTGGS
jgi:hypothetical protein